MTLTRAFSISLCVLAAAFMALSFPALAQNAGNTDALLERIDRLERDLNLMQRQVYSGKGGPAASTPVTPKGLPAGATPVAGATRTPGAPLSEGEANLMVQMQSRMDALESEVRNVTGQFEEMSFRIKELGTRLDKMSSDIDMRLGALERSRAGASPGSSPDASSAATPSPEGDTSGTGFLETPAGGKSAAPVAGATQTEQVALPEGTPESQYEYARGLLEKSDYAGAESAFKTFLERHKDHDLAGNAQYWLGESYYVRKDYTNAALVFAEGYKSYGKGAKGADILLKLGLSLSNLGEKEQACKSFAELEKKFPDAPDHVKSRLIAERKTLSCP